MLQVWSLLHSWLYSFIDLNKFVLNGPAVFESEGEKKTTLSII